ncbi:tRNA (adenosine(37)-N6)-threonylcarbamoyltransferase complex dimerization subunit type 1 TsaB [Enterobacter hormaechei]
MRILAIDTATEACSVALWNDGTIFAHFEECPREHTQRILPLVKTILTEGNTALTDLDALAYGRGPGSFTGVRIGIGIAQGLALGADLPMIGVSTLATMAQGAWRMTGVTGRLKQLSGVWATVGTGWAAWPEMAKDTGLTLVDGNMLLPAAEDMLPIACQLLAAGKTVAVEHAEPVYLRNTVAWKKLPGRE